MMTMMNAMGILRRYRLPEALVVAGFTFVGSLFAVTDPAAVWSPRALLFFLASYLVIVSIYAFNSWAGLRDDRANPRFASGSLGSERGYATLSAVAFGGATLILIVVDVRALLWSAALFLLLVAYSFPRYGAKYLPVAGTVLHLVIGVTQFQTGWMLFREVGRGSLTLSLYFGALLAAGHVNHELIDHDADRAAGILSGAVRFGARKWRIFHALLALAALVYLALLPVAASFAPFLVASAVHVASSFLLLFGVVTTARHLSHRRLYRAVFFLAGAAYLMERSL